MDSLGKTLRDTREKSSLKLRDIEKLTGISNAYLSQLETDKIKKPSASVLYKIANAYKLDLNTLLKAAGIIEQRSAAAEAKSRLEREVAFYKDSLTKNEEDMIISYIQFIKGEKKSK